MCFMKAFSKLGITLFTFVLSGCAVITNFDGVLALRRLGNSRRDNENYVQQQEKLFYRLVSDIKVNRLEKGLSGDKILSIYGQPILSKPIEDNQQIKKVLVYRHPTQYFSSEMAYLYFDEREQLYSWELKY